MYFLTVSYFSFCCAQTLARSSLVVASQWRLRTLTKGQLSVVDSWQSPRLHYLEPRHYIIWNELHPKLLGAYEELFLIVSEVEKSSLSLATPAGSHKESIQGGSFCSLPAHPCSLGNPSLQCHWRPHWFQHILKTSRDTQPCGLKREMLDYPMGDSHCWNS